VVSYDFSRGEAQWFAGGRLNVSYNCIDRHLPARADQTALMRHGADFPGRPGLAGRVPGPGKSWNG